MERIRFRDEPPSELDDLGAHRLRKIPRVEGEFPTLFYLNPRLSDRLKPYQLRLLQFMRAQGLQCEPVEVPHISLSRVVNLSYVQVDPFVKAFQNNYLPLMRKVPLYLREPIYNMIVTGPAPEQKVQGKDEGKDSAKSKAVNGENKADKADNINTKAESPKASKVDSPSKADTAGEKVKEPKGVEPRPRDEPWSEVFVGLSAGTHFLPLIGSIDVLMSKFNQPGYFQPPVMNVSLLRVEGPAPRVKAALEEYSRTKEGRQFEKMNSTIDKVHLRVDKRSFTFDLK